MGKDVGSLDKLFFVFCLIISKSPSGSMAKMQVNVEMDDLTKEEDNLTIEFVQPNRKGWWTVCVFPSDLRPALKCF